MTTLVIFKDDQPTAPVLRTTQREEIARALGEMGIRFEQWQANAPVAAGAPQDVVLDAYQADVARLKAQGGYRSCDVVSLTPDNPNREAIRKKFFAEHTHSEDEVRFFVEGAGIFYLHLGQRVYAIRCEKGDLLGVPAGTSHWFDTGASPSFIAIRLFSDPKGWDAAYTGADIASRFPTMEQL